VFHKLVAAKEKLSGKIAAGAEFILAGPTGPTADWQRDQAREALRQQLLVNLSGGYATGAILQSPFSISSGGVAGPTGAPRLSGKPVDLLHHTEGDLAGPHGVSISTSKVPLVEGHSQASFLVNVSAEAQQKNVHLDLNYVVNELEYDVQNVNDIDAYQASSWLSFIVPVGSTATNPEVRVDTHIGPVEVPIPLRAYPTPPSLLAQDGPESYPSATELDKAKLWNYSFSFEHQWAAQDIVYLNVTYNFIETASRALRAGGPDLFDFLAQFVSIYPELKQDLAQLPAWRPGVDYTAPLHASTTLADLAEKIADTWAVYPPQRPQASDLPGLNYWYSLDVRRKDGRPDTLLMIRITEPGNADLRWPDVYLRIDGIDVKLDVADQPNAREIVYRYPETAPTFGPLTHTIVFNERNVIHTFNAWAGVSVVRNQYLTDATVGLTGPQTNSGFVYQTPVVRFIARLTPILSQTNAIEIAPLAGWTGPTSKKPLPEYMRALFSHLLEIDSGITGPRPNVIRLDARYGFNLAETRGPEGLSGLPVERLVAFVPILMQPAFAFHPGDLLPTGPTAFVSRLSSALEQWQSNNQPSTRGGLYALDVSVFSPDVGPTGPGFPKRPILELQNLQLRLDQIEEERTP
jgi:hypothetical protein